MGTLRVKWLLVILLSFIAGGLVVMIGVADKPAVADVTTGASGDVFAVAGRLTSDSYGIYLIDTSRGTMAVYQWLPSTKKLRLLAARNYLFDTQLDEYNTEPLVRDIKELVKQSESISADR